MIKLITTGKIKEKYLKEAISEYTKRLSKYTKLEIIELNDYDFDNKNIVLEKEKEQILKHISDKDYIVTLEIEGKQFTSEEFSKIDINKAGTVNVRFSSVIAQIVSSLEQLQEALPFRNIHVCNFLHFFMAIVKLVIDSNCFHTDFVCSLNCNM